MKHPQITGIDTGKTCSLKGKNRETGNFNIEFEWGPWLMQGGDITISNWHKGNADTALQFLAILCFIYQTPNM